MGTMVNEKSGHKPVPITIDGVTYDASGWMSHHPGGAAIIESYAGRDATDVFMVMHSQGALKTLKTLPRMNVCLPTASNDNKSSTINEDFQKLRQDIIQQGHFSCSPLWYTYKCTTTLGLMLLSTLLVMWGQWYTVGAVVMGLAYQQLGWLAHDFCHHQVFNNRRLNNFFGLFFGNFCQGFSVTWWKERHNGHHASTNVVGHDPDIDNLPLLAWDLYDIRRAAPSSKKIIRYQHWYFLPLVSLLRYIWCTQSILMVKSLRHHPNRAFRKQYSAEATLLLLHYIARLVFLVVMMPSVATAVWFSVISDIVGGFGIAIIVFLNHYPIPKVPGEEWPDMPFAVCQLENTVNVRRGIVTDWICGGLNYQIEHHLFPTLPRHNLSSITPQVKAFCKKHNLSYRDPQMYSAIYNLLKYAKSMALAAA